jgi:isopenicillin N synthase-like dioxygenase
MFTFLLLSAGAMGLQIKPVDFGEFYDTREPARVRQGRSDGDGWLDCDVPAEMPAGGAALVNTGALLARWTNDNWRATAHRVIVPDADAAQMDRFSIAAFFDPDSDSTVAVHPRFVPAGAEPKYEPTTGLEFLTMMLQASKNAGKATPKL